MPAPVLYVTDLTYDRFDPADLFDVAFLAQSSDHTLQSVVLPAEGDGERILDALAVRTRAGLPRRCGAEGLREALAEAGEPVNLVVVGGYRMVADVLTSDRPLIREKVARLFVVGGHANDYTQGRIGERLPIDPRLKERNPERFSPTGDPRVSDPLALSALLTSGEGVIWLPRDICLWRYAAPHLLVGRGELTEFLCRELFWTHLQTLPDRYDAADAPALLSTLPALLLAVQPDPFLWMRLFRAITARVETDASGAITAIDTRTDRPNLYAVIAIDGAALTKRLTEGLVPGS